MVFGNPETSLKPHESFIHCYFIWSVFHASTYSDLSYLAVKQWAQEKLHRWRGDPGSGVSMGAPRLQPSCLKWGR